MADMQNLVERLERAVGRLEAASRPSDTCRGNGYGVDPSQGKQPMAQHEALCPVSALMSVEQLVFFFGADFLKRVV